MKDLFYSNNRAINWFDTIDEIFSNRDHFHQRSYSNTTLTEKEDFYYFSLEMPGVAQEDIDIKLEDRILTIKAIKRNRFGEKSTLNQRYQVPKDIDSERVEPRLQNGLLEFVLYKSEQSKPKTICINSSRKSDAWEQLDGSDLTKKIEPEHA
jgi:HSP20 family protein